MQLPVGRRPCAFAVHSCWERRPQLPPGAETDIGIAAGVDIEIGAEFVEQKAEKFAAAAAAEKGEELALAWGKPVAGLRRTPVAEEECTLVAGLQRKSEAEEVCTLVAGLQRKSEAEEECTLVAGLQRKSVAEEEYRLVAGLRRMPEAEEYTLVAGLRRMPEAEECTLAAGLRRMPEAAAHKLVVAAACTRDGLNGMQVPPEGTCM